MVRSPLLLAFVIVLGLVAACSPPDRVAVVDGAPIAWSALEGLHPSLPDEEERARSVYLLIIHLLLLEAAAEDFGIEVDEASGRSAFEERTSGLAGDVDAVLAERGVTRKRVQLEADLDVIRSQVESELVRSEAPGFDIDAAYRTFLAVNSRVCLEALEFSDEAEAIRAGELGDAGATFDELVDSVGAGGRRIDLGCDSPASHGGHLASVALDGEPGRVYGPGPARDAFYLVVVTERDSPALEEVREQVLEMAVAVQGPGLFDAWAVEVLRSAEVEVDPDVGRWGTDPESGNVPLVLTET